MTKFGFIMTIFTGSSTVSKLHNMCHVPINPDVM